MVMRVAMRCPWSSEPLRGLRRFGAARQGAVSLLTALSLASMLAATILGLLFMDTLNYRTNVEEAADAAVVASVSSAAQASVGFKTDDDSLAALGRYGENFFFQHIVHLMKCSNDAWSLDCGDGWYTTAHVTVTKTATGLSAHISWDFYLDARKNPYIPNGLPFFDKNRLFSGIADAAVDTPAYVNFYLMPDISNSMGLAATSDGIDALRAATFKATNGADSCELACHSDPDPKNDFLAIAQANNITLRIDVERQAIQLVLDKAKETEIVPGQYRFALYPFSNALYTYQSLTADLGAVRRVADCVRLRGVNNDSCPTRDSAATHMTEAVAAMDQQIPTPGDGRSAGSPKTFLFIISDGMSFDWSAIKAGPLDSSACAPIKARGIIISVLYTTYVIPKPNPYLPTGGINYTYDTTVKPFREPVDQLSANLKACASPGYFFQATEGSEISDQVVNMFNTALRTARITN